MIDDDATSGAFHPLSLSRVPSQSVSQPISLDSFSPFRTFSAVGLSSIEGGIFVDSGAVVVVAVLALCRLTLAAAVAVAVAALLLSLSSVRRPDGRTRGRTDGPLPN